MQTNPKENLNQTVVGVLIEQFQKKGYRCLEIREEDSTILILTHEKKLPDSESRNLFRPFPSAGN